MAHEPQIVRAKEKPQVELRWKVLKLVIYFTYCHTSNKAIFTPETILRLLINRMLIYGVVGGGGGGGCGGGGGRVFI